MKLRWQVSAVSDLAKIRDYTIVAIFHGAQKRG